MRTISLLLLLLAITTVSAHEKHISSICITEATGEDKILVQIKLDLSDYNKCSNAGEAGFEAWIKQSILMNVDSRPVALQLKNLSWGHDIIGEFILPVQESATQINLQSKLFVNCFADQKTIVAVQLRGQNLGHVLNAQTDTCAFPLNN